APHCRTPITGYSLRVTPEEHFLNWQQDPFGNFQARLVFPEPTKEFRVEVDLIAEMTTINPFDFFIEETFEKLPGAYAPELLHELGPYLELTAGGPKLAALAARVRDDIARPGRRTIDVLVEVNQLVQRLLRYDIRMEPGVFAPDETLTRGHGSCRDFSWLLVQLMRRLGFAARFASGYSIQLKADLKSLEGPSGVEQDVTDLHAWGEVFLPGAGWVGLDPTSGLLCGEGHIPLACTPDPGNAAAITGSFTWDKRSEDDELGDDFTFSMSVVRIDDPPRPTKPYSEETWRAIVDCGDRVEEALVAGDVRLTMGGEPTFISIDNREGEEWNTAALGPTKGKLADELLRRVSKRFAAGYLLHHGQGKWYPGEPLPRWAYTCFFRRDGEPVWRDPSLFASEIGAEVTGVERAGEAHARVFGEVLCKHLSVDPAFMIPGYEDAFYYLWREGRLPVNVDPFDSRLENETERATLRRVFQQGLKQMVGLALPLQTVYSGVDGFRWTSGKWYLRDERMYLVPGDSPMGLRLPLGALPWVVPRDRVDVVEQDPTAPRQPLPRGQATSRVAPLRQPPPSATGIPGLGVPGQPGAARPERGKSASGLVRTALCVEPRNGVLHVFMPPMS
ncbi:MAG TPA: transglutaminase family protein, partial [Burkholderiaceae bacterium]|nr:transglutaminase family protein [Burkholderiaceae bacterium]